MTEAQSPMRTPRRIPSWAQLRIWHPALLVLFAAIAIADIQDQRMHEPALIALAAGGFMLYGLLGWIGWWTSRRFAARLGPMLLFLLYAVALAALFLFATVIYLVIEHVYRAGHL